MAFTLITQGSFQQPATAVGQKVLLPSSCDYFRTMNLTVAAANQTTAIGVEFEWFGGGLMAADSAIEKKKSNAANAANLTALISSGGFTYVTVNPVVEAQAPNAITGITQANPAVVSQTNTYNEGDFVRIYNTAGMPQIGGMVFQISSVSGSGYTLLGLPATSGNGFAAAGTAGYTRRISKFAAVDPEYMYITNISQASSAVVSTSFDPSPYYVVGMKIRLSVPASFGMVEMNGLTGTITAINAVSASGNIGAYNMTINIDSSAFTAFSFPSASLSPTAPLFATLAPAGASTQYNSTSRTYTGYDFTKQPFHTGQFTPYMYMAPGANSPGGAANNVVVWQAYKMEQVFYGQ